MDNAYIFFRNDSATLQVSFKPDTPTCLDEHGYPYFGRVLHLLEPMIEGRGLTFCVTGWTVKDIPQVGSNVVACILQDEWGREPPYRDKVKTVFKTCGLKPTNLEAACYGGIYDKVVNFAAYLKASSRDNGQRTKSFFKKTTGKRLAPMVHLPLGCYAYSNVDYIPFQERRNDFYFNGSSKHQSKRLQIKSPKELSRERMIAALDRLKEQQPALNIGLQKTGSFYDSISSSQSSYLETMMDTKFALVPRGANLETFRFYEAIRYGCIPVGESFPKSTFYKDAPIIRLNDWSELSKTITPLLDQPEKLESLHQQARAWWNDVCSEEACAKILYNHLSDSD